MANLSTRARYVALNDAELSYIHHRQFGHPAGEFIRNPGATCPECDRLDAIVTNMRRENRQAAAR